MDMIREGNDAAGQLVMKFIKKQNLAVNVVEPTKNNPSVKGKMYQIIRLIITNIILVCVCYKMYMMKVNISENDVYVMCDIFRERYSMLFTTIVDSGIMNVSQFLRMSQLVIPFTMAFIKRFLETGSAGKMTFATSLIPSAAILIIDGRMDFTRSFVEMSLDPHGNKKHRAVDFGLTIFSQMLGIKTSSTAMILMENTKTLLVGCIAVLMYVQLKNNIEIFKETTDLISISSRATSRRLTNKGVNGMLNNQGLRQILEIGQ